MVVYDWLGRSSEKSANEAELHGRSTAEDYNTVNAPHNSLSMDLGNLVSPDNPADRIGGVPLTTPFQEVQARGGTFFSRELSGIP